MKIEEAKNILFHLRNINTYLDLSKDKFLIPKENIVSWKEATETVLKELEEQTNSNKELNKVLIHFKAVINEMAEPLVKLREESEEDCFIPRIYRDINECVKTNCNECIKQYFSEKVSE